MSVMGDTQHPGKRIKFNSLKWPNPAAKTDGGREASQREPRHIPLPLVLTCVFYFEVDQAHPHFWANDNKQGANIWTVWVQGETSLVTIILSCQLGQQMLDRSR